MKNAKKVLGKNVRALEKFRKQLEAILAGVSTALEENEEALESLNGDDAPAKGKKAKSEKGGKKAKAAKGDKKSKAEKGSKKSKAKSKDEDDEDEDGDDEDEAPKSKKSNLKKSAKAGAIVKGGLKKKAKLGLKKSKKSKSPVAAA